MKKDTEILIQSLGMMLIFAFIVEIFGKNYGVFFLLGAAAICFFVWLFTKTYKKKENKR